MNPSHVASQQHTKCSKSEKSNSLLPTLNQLQPAINQHLLSGHLQPIGNLTHMNQTLAINQVQANNSEPLMHNPNGAGKSHINPSFGSWMPQLPPADAPNIQNFVTLCVLIPPTNAAPGNWKVNKKAERRCENSIAPNCIVNPATCRVRGRSRRSSGGYKSNSVRQLQSQSVSKTHIHKQKRKFHKKNVPLAPRNTSSFIIRAKKSGGIASLISPYPVTPAVLPTPIFSPSKEVLGDMAKEEWGVDGYGSMNGLIRLRYPGQEADGFDDEEEDGVCSSESDMEEHVEVERRLDQDLSRFEMVSPNYGVEYNNVFVNRMDDQDTHIEQLEAENITLKERLFLMARELTNLTQRLQSFESQNRSFEDISDDTIGNCTDNYCCERDDPQTVADDIGFHECVLNTRNVVGDVTLKTDRECGVGEIVDTSAGDSKENFRENWTMQ